MAVLWVVVSMGVVGTARVGWDTAVVGASEVVAMVEEAAVMAAVGLAVVSSEAAWLAVAVEGVAACRAAEGQGRGCLKRFQNRRTDRAPNHRRCNQDQHKGQALVQRSHSRDSKAPTGLHTQGRRPPLCKDVEEEEGGAAAVMGPEARLAVLLESGVEAALATEVAEDTLAEGVKAEAERAGEAERGLEFQAEEMAVVAEAEEQGAEGRALVVSDWAAAVGLARVEQAAMEMEAAPGAVALRVGVAAEETAAATTVVAARVVAARVAVTDQSSAAAAKGAE